MSDDEEVEEGGQSCEAQIFDELPKCGCGGETIFIGHQWPDDWVKTLRAHFKCLGCGKVWSEVREKPLNIIFQGGKG